MSTITKEFTKEQLQQIIETDHVQCGEASALARIALASLELERGMIRRFYLDMSDCDSCGQDCGADMVEDLDGEYVLWDEVLPHLYRYDEYTAPPAPESVPDGVLKSLLPDAEKSEFWFEHDGKILFEGVKFNNAVFDACRAAMLQGAEQQQNQQQNIPENIPGTLFKPVADLYGITSPTGSETSFTFDAVEARDFIDGGWSCQEYVELERFQEAVSGNSPVIPDGWVACSERMPEIGIKVLCFPVNDEPIHATYNGQVWLQDISWSTCDEPIDNVISCNVSHWMPLPAAPQQEAK